MLELGFAVGLGDGEARGAGRVTPEMWVPGAASLRTSVLAAWVDIAAGYLAVDLQAPRVPVTLELDVHLYRPPPGDGTVHVVARPLKAGRAVVAVGVDITDEGGEPVGVGGASFMVAPDPGLLMPPEATRAMRTPAPTGRLRVPFAERARCTRREPGVAVLPRSDDGLNSARTVNGGLLALAVEEAALSLAPGEALASVALRYLRPIRVGPAVATATARAGLARVEVRDASSHDRLAVVATTRTFAPA